MPGSAIRGSSYVALLRALNVAGRTLPMTDLRAIFEALGATSVRTFIQSGNVVFDATPALARTIGPAAADAIATRADFSSPVILAACPQADDVEHASLACTITNNL